MFTGAIHVASNNAHRNINQTRNSRAHRGNRDRYTPRETMDYLAQELNGNKVLNSFFDKLEVALSVMEEKVVGVDAKQINQLISEVEKLKNDQTQLYDELSMYGITGTDFKDVGTRIYQINGSILSSKRGYVGDFVYTKFNHSEITREMLEEKEEPKTPEELAKEEEENEHYAELEANNQKLLKKIKRQEALLGGSFVLIPFSGRIAKSLLKNKVEFNRVDEQIQQHLNARMGAKLLHMLRSDESLKDLFVSYLDNQDAITQKIDELKGISETTSPKIEAYLGDNNLQREMFGKALELLQETPDLSCDEVQVHKELDAVVRQAKKGKYKSPFEKPVNFYEKQELVEWYAGTVYGLDEKVGPKKEDPKVEKEEHDDK